MARGAVGGVEGIGVHLSCLRWLWPSLGIASSRKPSLFSSGSPSACAVPGPAFWGVSLRGGLMFCPEAGVNKHSLSFLSE